MSPGPSQESLPDLQFSPILERPPDVIDDDDDQLIDLCFDNLDAIFSQSPDNDDDSPLGQPREWGDYMEGEVDYEDEAEVQELNWGDIDAWSERNFSDANKYLDDEDGLFEDINEDWLLDDTTYDEGQHQDLDEGGEIQHDLYGNLSEENEEESGQGLWQEMQAWQLDELQEEGYEREGGDSRPMYRDLGYMDDEDIEFVDIDENDLDEGVGLWRDEHDIIENIC